MADDGQSLEVVTEELRVADEEVRTQQELIDRLLRGRLAADLATSRLAAAVPVALVDTDGAGAVLRANPSAGALLHMDVGRLRGKPLLAFVAAEDRRAIRTALTRAAAGGDTTHLVAHLTPRRDGVVLADVAVLPGRPAGQSAIAPSAEDADELGGSELIAARWVLSPRGAAEEQDTRALSALAAMSTLPVVTGDLRTVLSQVAALTVQGTAPASSASLLVGPPSEPEVVVSTSTLAQVIDGAQFRAGSGPGWDAYLSPGPVTAHDVQDDARWAGLRGTVPEAAGTAVIAVPLLDGTAPVGVLTLYGTPALVRPAEVAKASTFAGTAAAIVREHRAIADLRRLEDQLRTALVSRAEIDQAKGILMGRHGIDAEQAFAELVRLSQHANVKLREVARQVVRTTLSDGSVDPSAAGSPALPPPKRRRGSTAPS